MKLKPSTYTMIGILLVLLVIIYGDFGNGSIHEKTKVDKAAQAAQTALSPDEQKYYNWLKPQIMGDGSNRILTKYIKDNLNNPKSFQHVKTNYVSEGKDKRDVGIQMVYRATNNFNAIITKTVTAKIIYETNTLQIIEQ